MLLSKMTKSSKQGSSQNEFIISMRNRDYSFQTQTKFEACQWVRVLNLIVTMHKEGISTGKVNPFDFEAFSKDKESWQ